MGQLGRRVHQLLGWGTRLLIDMAGVVLLGLMALTVLDVAMRYLFNSPISGVWDLTQVAMVLITFFGLAYCGYIGGHIVIDLLRGMSERGLRILDSLASFVGAVVMSVIAWRTLLYAFDVARTGAASMTLLLPFYPIVAIASFGSAIFAAVLFARAVWPRAGHSSPSDARE